MKTVKVDLAKTTPGVRNSGNLRIPQIPMQWMGTAWRLPSGKALAEFALQAGFLAPLLLGEGTFWAGRSTLKTGRNKVRPDDERGVTGQPR